MWCFPERRQPSFARAFKLPGNVVASGISASLDRGVLTVTVPKTPEKPKPQPTRIKGPPMQAPPNEAGAGPWGMPGYGMQYGYSHAGMGGQYGPPMGMMGAPFQGPQMMMTLEAQQGSSGADPAGGQQQAGGHQGPTCSMGMGSTGGSQNNLADISMYMGGPAMESGGMMPSAWPMPDPKAHQMMNADPASAYGNGMGGMAHMGMGAFGSRPHIGPLHMGGPPGPMHGLPGQMPGLPGPMHMGGLSGAMHGQPGAMHSQPGAMHGQHGAMHGQHGPMHGPMHGFDMSIGGMDACTMAAQQQQLMQLNQILHLQQQLMMQQSAGHGMPGLLCMPGMPGMPGPSAMFVPPRMYANQMMMPAPDQTLTLSFASPLSSAAVSAGSNMSLPLLGPLLPMFDTMGAQSMQCGPPLPVPAPTMLPLRPMFSWGTGEPASSGGSGAGSGSCSPKHGQPAEPMLLGPVAPMLSAGAPSLGAPPPQPPPLLPQPLPQLAAPSVPQAKVGRSEAHTSQASDREAKRLKRLECNRNCARRSLLVKNAKIKTWETEVDHMSFGNADLAQRLKLLEAVSRALEGHNTVLTHAIDEIGRSAALAPGTRHAEATAASSCDKALAAAADAITAPVPVLLVDKLSHENAYLEERLQLLEAAAGALHGHNGALTHAVDDLGRGATLAPEVRNAELAAGNNCDAALAAAAVALAAPVPVFEEPQDMLMDLEAMEKNAAAFVPSGAQPGQRSAPAQLLPKAKRAKVAVHVQPQQQKLKAVAPGSVGNGSGRGSGGDSNGDGSDDGSAGDGGGSDGVDGGSGFDSENARGSGVDSVKARSGGDSGNARGSGNSTRSRSGTESQQGWLSVLATLDGSTPADGSTPLIGSDSADPMVRVVAAVGGGGPTDGAGDGAGGNKSGEGSNAGGFSEQSSLMNNHMLRPQMHKEKVVAGGPAGASSTILHA
ncbi:hypothetical protein FOA52_012753 [Chlamydomonas sp. UWO 241]|nr:hypothetical protein FOA52_012753 [Chlamydomonas sp. UWO 241]